MTREPSARIGLGRIARAGLGGAVRAGLGGAVRAGWAMPALLLAVGLSALGGSPSQDSGRISARVGLDLLRVEAPFAGVPANGWTGTAAPTFEAGTRASFRVDVEGPGSHGARRPHPAGRLPYGPSLPGLTQAVHPRTPRGAMLFGLSAAPTNAPPHSS